MKNFSCSKLRISEPFYSSQSVLLTEKTSSKSLFLGKNNVERKISKKWPQIAEKLHASLDANYRNRSIAVAVLLRFPEDCALNSGANCGR